MLQESPFGKDILVSGADDISNVNKFTNDSSIKTLENLKTKGTDMYAACSAQNLANL